MTAVDVEAIRAAMARIVGSANCITDEKDQAGYVTDYRKLYRGRAAVVVRPGTTQQVSELMSWCFANQVPVVPQGGNTSLMGGSVPDTTGTAVLLNLGRMNKVVHI